ncbi:hypothetical protein JY97_00605 [Alkalispirochaeta odontotermitis]|nr:hypothetical protein JY97_00605 [Alkalispirochaeta odontotermitis]
MGCDIHIVIERKRQGDHKWTGLVSTDQLKKRPDCATRDYSFFAEVANVRGKTTRGNYPQNIPEDVSELAWQEYMSSPTDHHSPSHMSAYDFCALHNEIRPNNSRKEHAVYDLLGIDTSWPENAEYRVVFWFDN